MNGGCSLGATEDKLEVSTESYSFSNWWLNNPLTQQGRNDFIEELSEIVVTRLDIHTKY